jgi:hypothetical protein
VPFPVLLSTLIRSRFQTKPATLLIPIANDDFSIFPFLFAVEELYGTRYQSGSFSLINVGSSSFFPFHAVSLISRRRLTAGFLGLLLLIGLSYCGLLA